ncbi:MAG TPA: M23 family metallopeptidase [Longimicrobiales bacterium]|nr:M23 family metallopeptidase [Longimicrobiales bacterium]
MAAVYASKPESVDTDIVRSGQTLDGVLARGTISAQERADLVFELRQHIDPRRVFPGTEVDIHRWADDGSTRMVEIRLNADSTIRLERTPVGWDGVVRVTPTVVDTAYLAGTIEEGGSLDQALVNDDASGLPRTERKALAADLADIYGYRLDFIHDIYPGDSFRFAYEREVRPDGTSRRRRILAALVVNQGDTFPAIFYDPRGNGGDYFDTSGRSLHLMFKRYPVPYVRITSGFSWRRYHPVLHRYRPHLGTDFGVNVGTPVSVTADGTVRFAGRDGGYGIVVMVRHMNGYETRYGHLSRIRPGIRPGVRVKQGQVVGWSGATGLVTGPHLHYEIRKNGRPLNPRSVTLPAAPPVPKERMAEFREVVEQRMTLLDSLEHAQPTVLAADSAHGRPPITN